MLPDDTRHGTNAGYIAGCRAQCCRDAHATHRRGQRARMYLARTDRLRTDSLPTRRRIQALMALGYSTRALDREMGQKPSYLYRILSSSDTDVYLTTAAKVAAVYDRLSMTPPDTSTADKQRMVTRNRRQAAAKGFLPPMAWVDIDDLDEQPDMTVRDDSVDEVVVLRVLGGDFKLQPNRAERYEIVRRWQGSDNELERRTGWNVARMRRDMNTTEEVA